MENTRRSTALGGLFAVVLGAACSEEQAGTAGPAAVVDAGSDGEFPGAVVPASFACTPPTVQDPISVDMHVNAFGPNRLLPPDPSSTPPLENVVLEVRRTADDAVVTSGVTSAAGVGVLEVPTGGNVPPVGLRWSVPAGYPSGAFVPARFHMQGGHRNAGVGSWLLLPTDWQSVAASVGATYDPTKAIVEVAVARCNEFNTPVIGATVTITPGSHVFYATGVMVYDKAASATGNAASGDGKAIDFAVSPGPVDIDVTFEGETTRYSTTVVAGEHNTVMVWR